MSLNFQRTVTVVAGPYGGQGVAVSGLRTAFTVKKSDDPKANRMEVRVYNANDETARLFETTENSLTLQAGYEGQSRVLATGDITWGITRWRGPDKVTAAMAGDGLRPLSESRVSLSYAGAASAKQIIEDVVKTMGLELRDTAADLSGRFPAGWAFVGPARDAMTAISRRFGLSWSVQNNEVQVTEFRGTNTQDAVLISPETGMVNLPEPLEDDRDDTKEAAEKPGVKVQTLLNPLYEPGGVVVIRARAYDDVEYRIKTVEHDGDTHGAAWYSTLELVER